MQALTPDEVILGLLVDRPQHGYDLMTALHDPDRLGHIWTLSTSQVYAVLKRLEGQGMTTALKQESVDGPPRLVYHITQVGETALQTWLNEPQPSASVRRVRVEFLSRLYIMRLLNLSPTDMIARQKHACACELERQRSARDQVTPGVPRLAVELVINQLTAVLDWIDRCEMTPRS